MTNCDKRGSVVNALFIDMLRHLLSFRVTTECTSGGGRGRGLCQDATQYRRSQDFPRLID